MTKAWKVAALASLASLGIAASASADVRYAEPNGDGDQVTCSQSDPCGLIDAIESPFAVDGDEVVVLPGVYSLGNEILLIDNELNVHGAPGNFSAGRPTIVGSHDFGLIDVSSDGARVADLELDHNGEFFALIVDGQAVVERLIVRSAATDGACHVAAQENAAVIRDSVCLNEGGGPAVRVQPDLFVDPGNATLRNVTAISNGSHPGILGAALNDGALNLDVLNTIASGGPGADDVVASDESASDPASLVLGNSNYDTASADANSSVTAPGTGTNQMAPPLLTNIEGAFAQLAGSPTIDAGAADPLLGSLDILGEPRIQGPAPDIGADETANPPDTTAPGLRVKAKRKQKGPNVKVKVECDEPCEVLLRGKAVSRDANKSKRSLKVKFKRARADLTAGERETLKLKPKNKKSKREAKAALRDGAKFKAKIRATATDAAGNSSRDKVKVTLKR